MFFPKSVSLVRLSTTAEPAQGTAPGGQWARLADPFWPCQEVLDGCLEPDKVALQPALDHGGRGTGCPCREALPPRSSITNLFWGRKNRDFHPGYLLCLPEPLLPCHPSLISSLPLLSSFSSCHQAELVEEYGLLPWRRGERKRD